MSFDIFKFQINFVNSDEVRKTSFTSKNYCIWKLELSCKRFYFQIKNLTSDIYFFFPKVLDFSI